MNPLNPDQSTPPLSPEPDPSVFRHAGDDDGNPLSSSLPRGHAGIAWMVIAVMCLAAVAIHTFDLRDTPDESAAASIKDERQRENPIDAMLFELQGKYIVAAAEMYQDDSMLYKSIAKTMDAGTITQRQKFAVIANELMGPQEAITRLDRLEGLIEFEQESQQRDKPLMSADQAIVQETLRAIFQQRAATVVVQSSETEAEPPSASEAGGPPNQEAVDDHSAAVDPAAENLIDQELGWFGKLALTHVHPDDAARRDEVIAPARTLLWFIIGVFTMAALAGVGGFVGLVAIVALAFLRKIRGTLTAPGAHHGVYAETFAVWMVLFLALQIAAGAVSQSVPQFALAITFVAFLCSLAALAWPVMRGLPWAQVKRDIGWHAGRATANELAIGAGSYLMALPLLAIGIAITYVLMLIQQELRPAGPLFEPPSGPAHPIIEQLTGPDWFPKIMVLALGAIAAPIVEETMFRGVLHGHLRGATNHWGIIASVIFSTIINSFIFAAIHPQGWVAIPALMSLAIAFSLAREWRGSIMPAMVMHGMSNFFVMSLLITALMLSRSG